VDVGQGSGENLESGSFRTAVGRQDPEINQAAKPFSPEMVMIQGLSEQKCDRGA
jgi:hypothetical protein